MSYFTLVLFALLSHFTKVVSQCSNSAIKKMRDSSGNVFVVSRDVSEDNAKCPAGNAAKFDGKFYQRFNLTCSGKDIRINGKALANANNFECVVGCYHDSSVLENIEALQEIIIPESKLFQSNIEMICKNNKIFPDGKRLFINCSYGIDFSFDGKGVDDFEDIPKCEVGPNPKAKKLKGNEKSLVKEEEVSSKGLKGIAGILLLLLQL